MALTAAEKQRRYRERIKNDPERLEKQRRKDLERVRQKRKKVAELNNAQKNKLREQWRNQKRKQRDKATTQKKQTGTVTKEKRNNETNIQSCENNSNVTSKVRYLKKRCTCLSKKCERLESRVKTLQTLQERQKKRLHRLKIETDKKVQQLEMTVEKMKVREEILETSLKKTYKDCEKRSEKKLIKSLATNTKAKTYVAKLIGLTGRVRTANTKKKGRENKDIISFFLKDDVSRCTAGKKECRTKNKEKCQIRYMLDTLHNLYQKYRNEGGKFKFTTFYRNKPFYVLSPHLASRNTCICIKHNNIELKFVVLKTNSVLQGNLKEALETQSCNLKSYKCMHSKCNKCKQIRLRHCANDEQLDRNVTWYQWERIDHNYTKKEGTTTKNVTTKKTVKSEKTGKLRKLLQEFETDLIQFKKHYFNVYHQQIQYQTAVAELKENEVLIICDFSENYETKLNEEVQSMHFGASKSQVTLHTGMVYLKDKSQSFCTVSKNNTHQPPAIWAHLQPILKMIKEDFPNVSVIHFYSDGPTSQYRQKNNFYLLDYFTENLNLDYSTWSYFESGHGKGVADGIGGSVKRVLDKKVCFGRDINDASDAYNILKDCMKTVKIWYITDEEINKISSTLPLNVPTLVGTMQLHQITSRGNGTLTYRDVGCFCGELKGLCGCFGPKTHRIRFIVNPQHLHVEDTTAESVLTATVDPQLLPDIENSTVESIFTATIDAQHLPEVRNKTVESVFSATGDFQHLPVEDTTSESVFSYTFDPQHLPDTEDFTVEPVYTATVDPQHLPESISSASVDTKKFITNPYIVENNLVKNIPDLPVIFYDSIEDNTYMDLTIATTLADVSEKENSGFLSNRKKSNSSTEQINKITQDKKLEKNNISVRKENTFLMPNSTASSSSLNHPIIDLTASRIPEKKTLDKSCKFKTLKTVVKRQFNCDGCKTSLTLNRIAKCMCCKKWFCWECSGGQIIRDYICDVCLQGN